MLGTGREIKLDASQRYLQRKLQNSGLDFASKLGNSLLMGDATAYTVCKDVVPVVARPMGFWVSSTQWDYVHACREHL